VAAEESGMTYPPAFPHGSIEEILPDVFMVRGSVRMNPLIRITRNMAIVRHAGELTLVDPIRLNEGEERRLRDLGTVKRILRLGPLHGLDDPYYVDQFQAELWAQEESETYPEPKLDVRLRADAELPFPDAELFCFEGTTHMESALLIRRGGGLLITCDSIQNYGDYRYNNLLARVVMPFLGFSRTTLVGPIWLKLMTPEGGSLEPEFRRLLQLEFDHLLSAHGSLLRGGAHVAVEAAVDRAFRR
jgi:hypothetical protein